MSTKASLAHGEGYHLYEEALDLWHVWLELDTVEDLIVRKDKNGDRVTVSIPLTIWRAIRSHTLETEQILSMTEDEFDQYVEWKVTEHRAWLKEHKGTQLAGALTYGSPKGTKKQMIEKFKALYTPPHLRKD